MEDTHLDRSIDKTRPGVAMGESPRSLGDYRMLRRLGSGGMGEVYLAYDEIRKCNVAIKVLAEHLASKQGYVDRFYLEARSGRLLNHANIVCNLAYGQDNASQKHYMVLEYVDGGSAHALLDRQGRLAVGDAMHITLAVAKALEHAHARQIVHRDIKPDNILLSQAGAVKLSDFGLVRRMDEPSHLTATRQGFGTTPYMPYEQAMSARKADHRSDIYALGATLYHLVTGVLPFPGENHLEVVQQKRLANFVPASTFNPSVPRALDDILSRMMAFEKANRYQTASELIIELERSRLAAAVPSFADANLALKDRWVRENLANSEPTHLNLLNGNVPPLPRPTSVGIVWQLRFRNRSGRLCRAQASTEAIQKRLSRGRLPRNIEARSLPENRFQPLEQFPEFAALRPLAPKKSIVVERPMPPTTAKSPPRKWSISLIGIGIILGVAGSLIGLRWIGLLPF